MASEIERKFMPDGVPEEAAGGVATQIEQGYVAVTDEVEVRLRRAEGARLLTAKRGSGEAREEVEIELTPEQFDALWPLTEGRRLAKERRAVPLGDGLGAEVDIYRGRLRGLTIVEVEFDSEQRSRAFEAPAWMGVEVTGEKRYANQTLALRDRPPV
ncbi:MAG: CYTH domain-containing protein [Solirubrobacterales bacterium]